MRRKVTWEAVTTKIVTEQPTKTKILKKRFGVATIVYSGKLRKNKIK